MPIEIKELLIKDSLAKKEQSGHTTRLVTERDLEDLRDDLAEGRGNIRANSLDSTYRRELLEDILREVKRMLAEERRR